MKKKVIKMYSDIVDVIAEQSYSRRFKVGCVIIKDDNIISFGYNGTPKNWDNNCEYEQDDKLVTKDDVLHAETNAITKLVKSGISCVGAIMFVTCSPCIHCAKLIYQSGIKAVYYKEDYRDTSGLIFLKRCGIEVVKI